MNNSILALILLITCVIGYAQSSENSLGLQEEFNLAVTDTSKYDVKQIVIEDEDGTLESIRYFFHEGELRLIKTHRIIDAMAYGEGPPIADIHSFWILLFENHMLKTLKVVDMTEYYINYEKGDSTLIEGSFTSLDPSGECLQYLEILPITGSTDIVQSLFSTLPTQKERCRYCPYTHEDAQKYLALIKHE